MGAPIRIQHSLKVPVVTKPEYTLYFERANGLTLIHCDIHVIWTKGVRSRLLADWATLKSLHTETIYAAHTRGDDKHLKFLTTFGFHPAHNYEHILGETVVIHST